MKAPIIVAAIISCLSLGFHAPLLAEAKPVEETAPCLEENPNNTSRKNSTDTAAKEQKSEDCSHSCESCTSK